MGRAIKILQMLLVVAGLVLTQTSLASMPSGSAGTVGGGGGGGGGGDFPWPWGLEVAFPWEDIQGIWKVDYKGRIFYFGFRRTQERRLFITQFDANQCLTLGSGPGLIRDKSQKYVVAQVTMNGTGEVYRIAIYAFAESDNLPPAIDQAIGIPQHVMVARISSMTNSEREIAVQMVRISDTLEFKCVGLDKKLKF